MAKKKSKITLLLRDALFSTFLSLLTCFIVSFLFFNTSFFNPLSKALKDFSFLDVYYSERLDQKQSIDTNIVLVNIEHKTRTEIAHGLQKVLESKPKVVGFDVLLKEFEKTETDTLLASLLAKDKVVTTYVIQGKEAVIANDKFFKGNKNSGYANFNFDDENSVVREFIGQSDLNESFAAVLAKKFLGRQVWLKRKMDSKISKSRVINYQGSLDHYMHLNLNELIVFEENNLCKDKAVLFGYLGSPTNSAFDIEDKHFTPLNTITAGKSIPDMYGLAIHANVLSMLIADNFMIKVSQFWILLIMFICSYIASIYFIWLGRRLKISYRTVRKAVLFVFSISFVWFSLILFKKGVVLNAAPIIAVSVFSAGFVKYYKHLVLYLKTKRKFKSYI